jgi:type II secretory pathway component GspD/PulD (secretin)
MGYALGFREENGAIAMGRGDEFFTARSFPLQNLSPDATRLLFPDFLLPHLRADRENNALIASLTPLVVAKIGVDLTKLDVSRPQFEVQAEAWELASTRDLNQTIALTRSIGGDAQTVDFGEGTAAVRVENGLTNKLSATLNLLSSRGRARLTAAPHVTALSGARGTLFLGQTRYIKILQNRNGGQIAQALPLQIGTTLGVTPKGNDSDGSILLDINPRVSTVDDVEAATGLPTLGIREVSSSLRVRSGETVMLSGLDFDFDAPSRRRTLKIFPSKRQARERRALLVLVKARRLSPLSTP